MGAVKMMKGGFCMALLLLVVSVLLNVYGCGAASVEVMNSTASSWCRGSAEECLTMDLEFDFFMGSEISRMLQPMPKPVTPVSQNGGKPVVQVPPGHPYGSGLPPQNEKAKPCGQLNRLCNGGIYKP